jgi:hydroxymethylpyrimidine pyrophosphatase-like HAD family hydrolase
MVIHALACDYDGTIARDGRVDEATTLALARVRDSGRKVFLVTGRMLPDLRHVCPDLETMFDAVVAENGAVMYLPSRRETRTLGDAPEPALLDALARGGVRVDVGASIIAGDARDAEAATVAIRAAGVERSLIFNKGSLMLLSAGVNKGTGLSAVLDTVGMSPHTLAGVGDAENDHAFLGLSECAVAVADSVPALADRADIVTQAPGPAGVQEFVDALLRDEASAVAPALARHQIELGRTATGDLVTLPAHGPGLLVVGPTGTGKSTITGLLIERLLESKRTFCVVDPEGDYQSLADTPEVVVLGGRAEQALPKADELKQLVTRTHASVVLNLSAMTRAEKIDYAATIFATVAATRASSGLPLWLVVDEAHHIFPAEGSPVVELLGAGTLPVCLTTLSLDHLAPAARAIVNTVASTDLDAFNASLGLLAHDRRQPPPSPAPPGPLGRGEIAFARLGEQRPLTLRFQLAPRHLHHRRHLRKYTEGELPPERSFYFRGADGRLNLRAANLVRFRELAEGVDEETWQHHARRGEYSTWLREMIKDPELADEVTAIEQAGPDGSRGRILDAIRRRYAV